MRILPVKVNEGLGILTVVALLFCILSPLRAEGMDLYNGKNSVIFKDNSSEIADATILDKIVDKLQQEKGVVTINIVLICVEIVQPGEKEIDLANKRVAVLKSYFQQRLPGAVIISSGKTVSYTADKLDISETIANQGPDMLIIQASLAAQPGENTGENEGQGTESLEPWQLILLDKYQTVVEKHSYLCKQERHNTQYESDEDCNPNSLSDLDFCLCILRGHIDSNKMHCDEFIEYDLERMLKLRETSGEVVAISQEITKQKPEAGSYTYEPHLLDEEIDRQLLAIKHYHRIQKKADKGLQHLKKIGGGDPDNPKIGDVSSAYINWIVVDVCYGIIYSGMHRKETIHHVMELHNFVRTNLGLDRVDDTRFFPICVFTGIILSEEKTIESCDELNEGFVQPYLQEKGVPDNIPLE